MTLPSAEELAEEIRISLLSQKWLVEQILARDNAVLEAAAQEALDHPEAPAAAILKLKADL